MTLALHAAQHGVCAPECCMGCIILLQGCLEHSSRLVSQAAPRPIAQRWLCLSCQGRFARNETPPEEHLGAW